MAMHPVRPPAENRSVGSISMGGMQTFEWAGRKSPSPEGAAKFDGNSALSELLPGALEQRFDADPRESTAVRTTG